MDSKKLLWVFIGTLLVLFIYFISLDGMLLWDEHAYMANARNHLTQSYYTEDFRFPLLEFIVALTWTFTGESVFAAQLLAVFFSLLLILFVYLLSKELMEEKYALIAALVTGLSSQLLFWGFRVYNDILGMVFVVMSIYFFFFFFNNRKKSAIGSNTLLFFAGACTGLVFLARFPLVIIPGLFFAYFIYKKNLKGVLFASIGAGIPILAWMLDNFIRFGNPFYQFFEQARIVSEYSVYQSPALLLGFFWETFSFSLLFLVPFLAYVFYAKKNQREILLLLTAALIVNLVFYLFFVDLKLERYLLVFIPLMAVCMALGLKFLVEKTRHYNMAVLVLLSALLLAPILISSTYTFNDMAHDAYCTRDGAVKSSIAYVKENIEPGELVVADTWVYYGFHANARIYNWSGGVDIDSALRVHEPVFIIYTKHDGLDMPLEDFEDNPLLALDRVFEYPKCHHEVRVYVRNQTLSG